MARRRNSYSSFPSANPLPFANPARIALERLSRLGVLSPLSIIEDRRTFHPLHDVRPARTIRGAVSSISVKPRRHGYAGLAPDTFHFKVPESTVVCLRRQRRREVMFAKRKTGKGARAPRRRNYYSGVSCR